MGMRPQVVRGIVTLFCCSALAFLGYESSKQLDGPLNLVVQESSITPRRTAAEADDFEASTVLDRDVPKQDSPAEATVATKTTTFLETTGRVQTPSTTATTAAVDVQNADHFDASTVLEREVPKQDSPAEASVGTNTTSLLETTGRVQTTSTAATTAAMDVQNEASCGGWEPLVSICVPVFNGASTVARALQSVLNQTLLHQVEILVSVDLSEDETEKVVASLKAPNMHVFVHKERLGFVRNTNFLLRQARGQYVSILPADDWVPANYVESLLGCFQTHPEAVNCFPDIVSVKQNPKNKRDEYKRSHHGIRDVRGNLTERIEDVIRRHCAAVGFRGLVKRSRAGMNMFLPNFHKDMLADTGHIMEHAIAGELVQWSVPYYKRMYSKYSKSNHKGEHGKWKRAKSEDIFNATVDLLAHFYQKARHHVPHARLLELLRERLESSRDNGCFLHGADKPTKTGVGAANTSQPGDGFADRLMEAVQRRVSRPKVAVLGAGIQGTLMALLFRKYGYDVTMFDNSTDILTRASNNHEGKIHMGFVYGADKTFETGRRMMEASLAFAHVTEDLLEEKVDWRSMKSTKFHYLVPHTSLVSPDELEGYFHKLQGMYDELVANNPHLSYLGERPGFRFHPDGMRVFLLVPSIPKSTRFGKQCSRI